jgi:hypothetical protein
MTDSSASPHSTNGGFPLQETSRKQLSRVVALARYDLDRERSSPSGSEVLSKKFADTTAALAVYDDLHPAEALAALEIDGERWNRSYYETRRAHLLSQIGARPRHR